MLYKTDAVHLLIHDANVIILKLQTHSPSFLYYEQFEIC